MLLAISVIPILAGLARLAQLAGAPIGLIDSARVLAPPSLVFVTHITAAVIFLTLGAFQFLLPSDHKRRQKHRMRGRVVATAAFVTGVSAVWLTLFFPHAAHDGLVLNCIRLAAGSGIAVATAIGVRATRRRRIADHRKWMMRAYALGCATGVQVFVVAGWTIIADDPAGIARAFIFGGCWIACLLFAELRVNKPFSEPAKGY